MLSGKNIWRLVSAFLFLTLGGGLAAQPWTVPTGTTYSYFTANVGIGPGFSATVGPTATLDVNGTTHVSGKVSIGTASSTNILQVYSTASADGLAIDGTTAPAITFKNAGSIKGYIGLPTLSDNYFNGTAANDLAIRSEGGSVHIGRCCASPTLTVSGTSVGIGTTGPTETLQVAGAVKVTGTTSQVLQNSASLDYLGTSGARIVAFGPDIATAATFQVVLKNSDGSNTSLPRLLVDSAGNVCIGSTSAYPGYRLDVTGGGHFAGNVLVTPATGNAGFEQSANGSFNIDAPGSVGGRLVVQETSGNVGIGNNAPNYKLDVTGNIHATGSITGGTVLGAVYQDVAEWVPSGQRLLPGTVVTINTGKKNEVLPSSRAYDTSVAGVVSEKPGVLLGVEGDTKSQIATTGRVRVRVDATGHPIAAGDLLVTGQKPGMAMYSEPVDLGGIKFHRPGTILGKALESLQSGEGEILVLLSLQ